MSSPYHTTMSNDSERQIPLIPGPHTELSTSTNHPDIIGSVATIPNTVWSTISHDSPPSERVSGVVTDTITSITDTSNQLPSSVQSNIAESQLVSRVRRNTMPPNPEQDNELSSTSAHPSLWSIIGSLFSRIQYSLSSSNATTHSAIQHETNEAVSLPTAQDQNEEQAQRHLAHSPPETSGPQRDDVENSDSETHAHVRPASRFLMYIPEQASPFPFPLLCDVGSNLAWPIIDCIERTANEETGEESTRTVHILGMPFHLTFTMRPSDPNDVPDTNKARAYVAELERVDAELRSRMTHFSLGSAYVETSNDASMQYLSGCGVCLEPYPAEDKPAWFTEGKDEPDETVVVIPCQGFHTIHASCLVEWLSSKAPSQWSCPYCRSPLRSNAKHDPPPMSLREHVKQKEREAGWRCDAPACFPCYSDGEKHESPLIKLMPCRHEVHLDCLCTNMRIEMAYAGASSFADQQEEETDDDDYTDSIPEEHRSTPYVSANIHPAPELVQNCADNDTIGKWVTCSVCRKDAWAHLPRRRRPRRCLHRSLHGLVS